MQQNQVLGWAAMWRMGMAGCKPWPWAKPPAGMRLAVRPRTTASWVGLAPLNAGPALATTGAVLVMAGCSGVVCLCGGNDLDLTVKCEVCKFKLIATRLGPGDDCQCDECWKTGLSSAHSCPNPACRAVPGTAAALSRTTTGIFSTSVAGGYDLCDACHARKRMELYTDSWMEENAADTVARTPKEAEALRLAQSEDGKEIVVKNPYDPFLWDQGYKKMRFVLKGEGPQVEVHYWQHRVTGEKRFFKIMRPHSRL